MNTKQLTTACWAMVALVIPALGQVTMPTLEQAVKYAESVVLVKRTLQNDQIHSYVKEVWRSGSDAAALPPVGSEYGRPSPYRAGMPFPETDMIVFDFGKDRATGLPNVWRTSVTAKRRVPAFLEEVPVVDDAGTVRRFAEEPIHVDDLRSKVKRTKPAPAKPNH